MKARPTEFEADLQGCFITTDLLPQSPILCSDTCRCSPPNITQMHLLCLASSAQRLLVPLISATPLLSHFEAVCTL